MTNKTRITPSSYVPGITKKAFSEELSLPQRFSDMHCVFDLRRELNDSHPPTPQRPTVCNIWSVDKIRFMQMSVKIFLFNCNMKGDSLITQFSVYRGADKSLARPGRKQTTATKL